MSRLRYNGLSNSLGAALTAGGTTITFASKLTYAGGDVPTISGSDYIPLSILDADGKCAEVVHLTAYTSAATTGTIARGKEDTSGAAHDSGVVVVNGPTVADIAAAPGQVIAYTRYAPGSTSSVLTTSATHADVDATNLVVTFTAPDSGAVFVDLSAGILITNNPAAFDWGLREGTTLVTGSVVRVGNLQNQQGSGTTRVVIDGLTPGSSYTYKWSHARVSGSGDCYTFFGGASEVYPATMVVTAAP